MHRFLLFTTLLLILGTGAMSQSQLWSVHIDTSTTFSSPRAVHLNTDGVLDIVIGGGLDGSPQTNGINAIDGATGAVLWSFATEDEIFGSARFQDITSDGIADVFIGGRYAEFYAINGATGALLWEFFPYSSTVALDSGWFNFYSPQFIADQNSDGLMDILVANGGNHSAPSWDTLREPGMLMILDAATGNVMHMDTMPDGEETYCSPTLVNVGGVDYILYGSGGEDDGGALWKVPLSALLADDISGSVMLAQHSTKGFIAPTSVADLNGDGTLDFINQGYGGTIRAFDGATDTLLWMLQNPDTESSAAPVIGNFTGSIAPDVFAVLARGNAPSFFDYYQIMIDGATGQLVWKDSIADLHFNSGNAVDLDLNGRDEVLVSLNYHSGYFTHQILALDFHNNTVTPYFNAEAGVNLGSSPLVDDLDGNGLIDVVYAYRADSLNPMGAKGFKVARLEGSHTVPGPGIAWGGYMGNLSDGAYTNTSAACGGMLANLTSNNISCNGFDDGNAKVTPTGTTGFYNVVWSNGSMADSIGGLEPGVYTVTVTDSAGCFDEATVVMSDPNVLSQGGAVPLLCYGDSTAQITVSSTGCPCMFSGCLYDWSSGDSIKTATNLWGGWHYLSITHLDGCVVYDSVYVDEPAPLLINEVIQNVMCYGDSTGQITTSVTGNQGPCVYNWSNGDSTTALYGLTPDTLSLSVVDSLGCSDSTGVMIITAPLAPLTSSLTYWYDSTGTCAGGAHVSASGGTPAYSFLWNDPSSITDSIANGLCAGDYVVVITDSNGCQTTDSVTIYNILSTDDIVDLDHVKVYPNPTSDVLNIELPFNHGWTQALLTNAMGQVVQTVDLQQLNNAAVSVKNLSAGYYQIVLLKPDAYKRVSMVVVE